MIAADSHSDVPEPTSRRGWDLLRTMGAIFGVVVLLLLGHIAISGMMEGYCHVWPTIGTQFAPDYSESAFEKITLGMTETDVVNLIGRPLSASGRAPSPNDRTKWRPSDQTWMYSQDTSSRGGDWAWLSREVVFHEGRVVQTVRWVYYD